MPFIPKVPDSCEHLDLALVGRTLAKHHGDIAAAAKELGVPKPDLSRLTWSKPHLLDEAHEEMELFVARAWAEVIRALDSDDPDRRQWGAEEIMSSYLARNHPFSPARRGAEARTAAASGSIVFKWQDGADTVMPTAAEPAAEPIPPSPPEPPGWQGPGAPPPLVAAKYRPWEPRR